MNVVSWMLAGGLVGWAGYSFLHFNAGRGLMVSIVIGTVGGFFGGKVLAPVLTAAAAGPGELSASALLFAAAVAAAFVALGNLVYERWGV